jgi:hypothetical protein
LQAYRPLDEFFVRDGRDANLLSGPALNLTELNFSPRYC